MSDGAAQPEFELKARLEEDVEAFGERLREAGWRPVFRGLMRDRRYDTPGRDLEARDEVLRIRRYRDEEGRERESVLAWKGPAARESGLKRREEVEARIEDAGALAAVLARLGYSRATFAVDRRIAVWEKGGVTVRTEEFPRMDVLVEIEGDPSAVEARIPELGLRREAWLAWSLADFFRDYEERTGRGVRLTWSGEDGDSGDHEAFGDHEDDG